MPAGLSRPHVPTIIFTTLSIKCLEPPLTTETMPPQSTLGRYTHTHTLAPTHPHTRPDRHHPSPPSQSRPHLFAVVCNLQSPRPHALLGPSTPETNQSHQTPQITDNISTIIISISSTDSLSLSLSSISSHLHTLALVHMALVSMVPHAEDPPASHPCVGTHANRRCLSGRNISISSSLPCPLSLASSHTLNHPPLLVFGALWKLKLIASRLPSWVFRSKSPTRSTCSANSHTTHEMPPK